MSAESAERTSEIATLGAGCFWCVEAVLSQVEGVLEVRSGYMGGSVAHPSYEQVCTGGTGHVEVVQVRFDPARVRYAELLEWFFELHDPTTKDRQGEDVGTQYRSVIFFHSEEQRATAVAVRDARDRSGRHADPIVTEIAPAGPFWPAETYHDDYYRRNRAKPYCRLVIAPKLAKLGLEA
jgi:peptide-methionine (S)-S-oxide reductase